MGLLSSSVITSDGCVILDERNSYILMRNYVIVLKMISFLEQILLGKTQAIQSMQSNYISYLVDEEAMLNLVKELPEEISGFASLSKTITGTSGGEVVEKEITFYSSYNNFFLTEQHSLKTDEEKEDRLKEMIVNLKAKTSMIESLIQNSCIPEIGIKQ